MHNPPREPVAPLAVSVHRIGRESPSLSGVRNARVEVRRTFALPNWLAAFALARLLVDLTWNEDSGEITPSASL